MLGREFPVLLRKVVLALVVVEATEVIGCAGCMVQCVASDGEHLHIFETIGEAAAWGGMLGTDEVGIGLIDESLPLQEVAEVVGGERRCLGQLLSYRGDGEHLYGLVEEAGLGIVESELVVVAHLAMHEGDEAL